MAEAHCADSESLAARESAVAELRATRAEHQRHLRHLEAALERATGCDERALQGELRDFRRLVHSVLAVAREEVLGLCRRKASLAQRIELVHAQHELAEELGSTKRAYDEEKTLLIGEIEAFRAKGHSESAAETMAQLEAARCNLRGRGFDRARSPLLEERVAELSEEREERTALQLELARAQVRLREQLHRRAWRRLGTTSSPSSGARPSCEEELTAWLEAPSELEAAELELAKFGEAQRETARRAATERQAQLAQLDALRPELAALTARYEESCSAARPRAQRSCELRPGRSEGVRTKR